MLLREVRVLLVSQMYYSLFVGLGVTIKWRLCTDLLGDLVG